DPASDRNGKLPFRPFELFYLSQFAIGFAIRQGKRPVPQRTRAHESAGTDVFHLPVVAGEWNGETWIGQSSPDLKMAVGGKGGCADQVVEVDRQFADDAPLDIQFEQITQSDPGDGERDEYRDGRRRPQPEADRVSHQRQPSGTKYPKPRRVSMTSLPSFRRRRATMTSIAFGSRSLPESYRCSASSVGATTRPA